MLINIIGGGGGGGGGGEGGGCIRPTYTYTYPMVYHYEKKVQTVITTIPPMLAKRTITPTSNH